MSEPRQAIGLYGGTFNPVHHAHLRLAEEACDALNLQEVRWIPAGQPPHREAPQVSAEQRLTMVRLATAGNPRFSVDAAEVEAQTYSYTILTLERLRQHYGPAQPLVLLLGADAAAGLASWLLTRRIAPPAPVPPRWRLARVAGLLAVALGATGLVLYSFDPAAAGLVLAAIALTRIAVARHGATASR